MQIVIELDDDVYKEITEEFLYYVHTLEMASAIKEGIPLPKGHGSLKDVSELFTITDIRADGSEFTYVPYSEIEDAPTVIEADKGGKE